MSRPPVPDGPPTAPPDAWHDYLAAARRLDTVRRVAGSAVSEQAQLVRAAQQELGAVRARLAGQRSRLVHEFGVSDPELTPLPAEVATAAQAVAGGPAAAQAVAGGPAAAQAVAGGPAAALTALRQAAATADAADAVLAERGPATQWATWTRNLLIYGPFAAAVLIVQIVLYLVAPAGSLPTYALLCGLSLPVLAFGMGWLTIGFVFGGTGAPGPVDRTPILGAIVCLTPVILTCMAVGLLALLH